jgi:hypothetical protein
MNSQEEGWSPFMGDNPSLVRFKITNSKPPPPKAAAVSNKKSSSSSPSEKGSKRKRGRPSANVLTCHDDIFNYWTSVLAQDPDDLLVDEEQDPGFVRCVPCSATRMRARKIVLIQHVVTQRHVDLTKTHITFYRIHQHVSEEEESSDEEELAKLQKQLADDTRWLEEEIAHLESSRPPPPPPPQDETPQPPPLAGAVGETFRQRLARIAEEETRKLVAKK